jgi:hypothetical protein
MIYLTTLSVTRSTQCRVARLLVNNVETIQSGTFLTSRLLSKNITIGIYKTIILSVVLHVCETLSVTLREAKTEGV